MGNRVSIQFVNNDEKSVVLFDHWGGMERVESALEYVRELREEVKNNSKLAVYPLWRLEPNTVMVDYVSYHRLSLVASQD